MAGRVYLVGAGPGDVGLLTLKGKACIETSDVVVYDRLVSDEILALIPETTRKIYVGKEAKHHVLPQAEIDALLVELAVAGQTVTRLKGGDPLIFGRGAEEAEALQTNGIAFEIVPGISSAVAAPAYAGIPLTHRQLAAGFHVVTGHECLHSLGTPWELLALSSQTLVILMGTMHLPEICTKLISHGRQASTPVAVIAWGTTSMQQTVVGDLQTIATRVQEMNIGPPAVIVVGDVVTLRDKLAWFPELDRRSVLHTTDQALQEV